VSTPHLVIAALGVGCTLFALWRALMALRSGAPRELVSGWFALMLAGAAVTTLLLRVL